jgi:hypothetical protein
MPLRSRISVVAGTAALLCAACNWGHGPSTTGQQPPRMLFGETSYDFGATAQGTPLTHTFAFRSAGGLDLYVDTVRASCGCTATVTPGRVLPPGGAGTVEVTCDTSDDFGRRIRTVTVYANDPAQPVTTLALRADVEADVAADPPTLYVGHLRRGQAAPNDVRVITASAARGSVGPVETHGRVIEARLRDATTSASGQRVRVAIKPDAPLGRFKETLVVHTPQTRRPSLMIPVTGTVDGDAAAAGHQPETP